MGEPGRAAAGKSFEHYAREGILETLDVDRGRSPAKRRSTLIGYCVGGTLLAVTLALMAKAGDKRTATATFFTTQVDFTHAGDLKVFVDEEQIERVEKSMASKGYLDGARMANAFNMLRSRDLIWSYVVDNYMKGKAPLPFDLLYWNSDSTRMTAANHSFYLRNCYLENQLTKGKMEAGRPEARPRRRDDPRLQSGNARRPHCACPLGLPWLALFRRQGHLRHGRLGPYRRCRQSARHEKVPVLDRRQAGGRTSKAGCRMRRSIPDRGGRTGRSGFAATTRRWCRRARPARKSTSR